MIVRSGASAVNKNLPERRPVRKALRWWSGSPGRPDLAAGDIDALAVAIALNV